MNQETRDTTTPEIPKVDYTPGQVAVIFNSSVDTIHNWRRAGRFPNAYATGSGHYRFPPDDIRAELKRQHDAKQLTAVNE